MENIIIMSLTDSEKLFLVFLFLDMCADNGKDISQYIGAFQEAVEEETRLRIYDCKFTAKPFEAEFSCFGKRFHAKLGISGKVCCNVIE